MSRRLEIELTSVRPDGTWTWRAAGAKQPKGELDGNLLPDGTAVGAVLRVDADFLVDGIEIIGVVPEKGARKEPELLEILGSGREEPLVTTQLAPKGRGGKGGGRGRDGRDRGRDRDGGRGRGGDSRGDRPRGPRPDPVPQRPTPKRLRPRRTHRDAALAEIPEEQRVVGEQVLRGGVPAVRDEARKQNEAAKVENRPGIPVDQVVAMAERLLPDLRSAEWLDRAEAAKRDLEELDLRDLRSVVVAADGGARSEEARALRDELAAGLTRRVEEEHRLWIADMEANLDAGRFVRALRLSSRPPKAGTPLPTELSKRMVEAVSKGLDARTKQELYAAALDALSFSPVRTLVTPAGKPEDPGEELLEAARRVADKAPAVAALFGVDPKESGAARKRRKRTSRSGSGKEANKAGTPKGARGGGAETRGGRPKGDRPRPSDTAAEKRPAEDKPAEPPSASPQPDVVPAPEPAPEPDQVSAEKPEPAPEQGVATEPETAAQPEPAPEPAAAPESGATGESGESESAG